MLMGAQGWIAQTNLKNAQLQTQDGGRNFNNQLKKCAL